MRLDTPHLQTLTDPLHGVVFTRSESEEIAQRARVLVALDRPTLAAMRRARQHDIRRLAELADWTEGESDDQRRDYYAAALVAYAAVHMTNAGHV